MYAFLLALLMLTAPSMTGDGAPDSAPPAAHDLHVSYGRMAVEGSIALCQIRFFRHDLEAALQAYHGNPDLRLRPEAGVDSLYLRYFDERFQLTHAGQRLRGVIVSSGEEEDMWWYTVKFEAPGPIRALRLRHTLLFETFADQRNIFKVKHFPANGDRTLYFARGAEEHEIRF